MCLPGLKNDGDDDDDDDDDDDVEEEITKKRRENTQDPLDDVKKFLSMTTGGGGARTAQATWYRIAGQAAKAVQSLISAAKRLTEKFKMINVVIGVRDPLNENAAVHFASHASLDFCTALVVEISVCECSVIDFERVSCDSQGGHTDAPVL